VAGLTGLVDNGHVRMVRLWRRSRLLATAQTGLVLFDIVIAAEVLAGRGGSPTLLLLAGMAAGAVIGIGITAEVLLEDR